MVAQYLDVGSIVLVCSGTEDDKDPDHGHEELDHEALAWFNTCVDSRDAQFEFEARARSNSLRRVKKGRAL